VSTGRLERLKARLIERRRLASTLTVEERRRADAAAAADFPLPSGLSVDFTQIAGVGCELVHTGNASTSGPVWIHLHGGAFCFGRPAAFRGFAATLAMTTGWRVLVPDYRLAPEAPYPAGFEDCCAVLDGLAASGARIVLSGDSAGGWMALNVVMARRDKGAAPPACLILMSPWLDLTVPGADANVAFDPVLEPGDLRNLAALHDPQRQAPALLEANFAGLPPTLIQTGTDDLLVRDSERLAVRAEGCVLQLWPEMFHGFQFFAPRLPQANEATDAIVAFARAHIH
jgi:epsilon-lactone hydrolase